MTDYNDGKIHGWNGGDCPIHPETLIRVFFRNSHPDWNYRAGSLGWLHHDQSDDVIAFQVMKEYKQSMVVWMNMYENDYAYTFKTKEEAMRFSGKGAKRIAVKLIEVQE